MSLSAKATAFAKKAVERLRERLKAAASGPAHENHVKGLRPSVLTIWFFATWFFVTGILGLLLPEQLSSLRGVDVHERIPKEQRAWLLGVQQLQALHSMLMAVLHVAVVGYGAVESPRLHSVNHMVAVRSLLLVDTIWLSAACSYIWVVIVPDMKDLGWHAGFVLAESFVLAVLTIPAFSQSRGGILACYGPVRFRRNITRITWIPEVIARNYGTLFWMAFSAVGAFSLLSFPHRVLQWLVGDFLTGESRAIGGVYLQLTGLSMLSEGLSLVAIAGSGIPGLHYVAVRMLWVWSFAMTAFFALARQGHMLLGLRTEPMLVFAVMHFVGSCLVRRSLPEFGTCVPPVPQAEAKSK